MMVRDTLARLMGASRVVVTRRGNDAIKQALRAVRDVYGVTTIRIPDQGGWLTYQQFPAKFGLGLEYVQTDDAKIEPDTLKEQLSSGDALLYENPGGYFASMDTGGIHETCRELGVPAIADVSGCIGRPCPADILICSFGNGKLLELGYGGCIGWNDTQLHDAFSETFEGSEKDIRKGIDVLEERREFLLGHCRRIKDDLKGKDIIHPEGEGIVVCVGFSGEEEKQQILEYCDAEGYEYTICPRYIRVLRPAVSIEVKRLRSG